MTSNSGPRNPKKYNPLNKGGSAATKKDFIEADYVNGIYRDGNSYNNKGNGEQVMRPLTTAETEWLAQFYSETEHDNFAKTEEIEIAQEEYNSLCKRIRHAKKSLLSTEEVLHLKVQADKKYKQLVQLRSETNTFYSEDGDRREIYKKNNDRKNDIFNVSKAAGKLISYDLPEFDKFSTECEKSINPEHLALDYLTRKAARKKVPRRKKNEEK